MGVTRRSRREIWSIAPAACRPSRCVSGFSGVTGCLCKLLRPALAIQLRRNAKFRRATRISRRCRAFRVHTSTPCRSADQLPSWIPTGAMQRLIREPETARMPRAPHSCRGVFEVSTPAAGGPSSHCNENPLRRKDPIEEAGGDVLRMRDLTFHDLQQCARTLRPASHRAPASP